MMKIAIPTRGNSVDDHFGHCEVYTLFTVDKNSQILGTELLPSPQGCGCKSNIVSILQEQGVEVMLAGNMGEGAYQILDHHGIKVYRGCSGDVRLVIQDYLNDQIQDSAVNCAIHEHHGDESNPQCHH